MRDFGLQNTEVPPPQAVSGTRGAANQEAVTQNTGGARKAEDVSQTRAEHSTQSKSSAGRARNGVPYTKGTSYAKTGSNPKSDKKGEKFSGLPGTKPTSRDQAFELQIEASYLDLWGFFNGRWLPSVSGLQEDEDEFERKGQMAYSLLISSLNPRLYQQMRVYQDKAEPAREAWEHLRRTYEATDTLTQIHLIGQMASIKLGADRNEEYLSRADSLRDEMFAVGLPQDEKRFVI
jgi:hypothetical protein